MTWRVSVPLLLATLCAGTASPASAVLLKFDVGIPPCTADMDCEFSAEGPYCDVMLGECRECLEDMQCPDGAICEDNACAFPCRADADCPGEFPRCDPESMRCVECLENDDCAPEEYCSLGACVPDFCEPGGLFCSGNDINRCDESGGDFEVERTCPEGEMCVDLGDGEAGCQEAATDSSGGGSAGEAGDSAGGSGDATSGGSADGGGDGGDGTDDSGCGGCTTGSAPVPSALLLLALWGWGRRRRSFARRA